MSMITARLHAPAPAIEEQSFPTPATRPLTALTPERVKRSTPPNLPASTSLQWTLQPAPPVSSAADRQLQNTLSSSALGNLSDSLVAVPDGAAVYAGFDALRSAFNATEMRAWILTKGLSLDTVVVKPDSISGWVFEGRSRVKKTFTLGDNSDWWQVSAKLRVAASALDPQGKGMAYINPDSQHLSRDTILQWYGVKPPTDDEELARVRAEISTTDWSGLSDEIKQLLAHRNLSVRQIIGRMDERRFLVDSLSALVVGKKDDEPITLTNVQVPTHSASTLTRVAGNTASASEVLESHGLPVPKTIGELRNVMRWLDSALPPAPARGDYTGLLAKAWGPGLLSQADKAFLLKLTEPPPANPRAGFNPLQLLSAGLPEGQSVTAVRDNAEHMLDRLLANPVVKLWGGAIAFNLGFRSAAGGTEPSALECAQLLIATFKLQLDPNAPARPGTVAGYDIYQAANHGRDMASVRSDIEAQLSQNPQLEAKAAPLMAHLLLASAAPEFLVRDVPATLRLGSAQWADLRLGVAIAEAQGGAGCSRAMSYSQIMALSRLDSTTAEQAKLLSSYGVQTLFDWGVMQGLYPKSTEGRYTPEQYQQASTAFKEQDDRLIEALKIFKTPLPSRREMAVTALQNVFPEFALAQLSALKVQIADADTRRNMKLSEPRTRPLVDTYMSGDLVEDRWMLLDPQNPPPTPKPAKTPYAAPRDLSEQDQAIITRNVQALNAKISQLPDVQSALPVAVDNYLSNLKRGLGMTLQRTLSNLPLADRQALEYGAVELFAIREQTGDVPIIEETPEQLEARRGRKGTLVRAEYQGSVRYFEVFPDKMTIVKRDDLPDQLVLGGTLQNRPKSYGRWALSETQVRIGDTQPFDFAAYSSDAAPRPGVTSPGIIIDKLGDTLGAAPRSSEANPPDTVPNTFSSTRTQAIIDRIMQGNFVHHRGSVLKFARGELPLEKQREALARNDQILLGMIPFVGAVMDLAKGNLVEGSRSLLIDTVGALLGGAGGAIKGLVKSTKVVAPFGAKAFRIAEKSIGAISGLLNPLDGAADLMAAGAKGVIAAPRLLSKASKPAGPLNILAAQEKFRTYLGTRGGMAQAANASETRQPNTAQSGQSQGVPVVAIASGNTWYAVNPQSGLPWGTPLVDFKPANRA